MPIVSFFVSTLAEACLRAAWEVHGRCLMRNHFHLAVETPLGNLVDGMKWSLGAYTIRFNARHRLRGHLFAGRYKSLDPFGWGAEDLAREAKGHPVKVRLARRLRRETTMTLQWIAKKLSMGSWTYVSNLLRPGAKRQTSVKDKD